MDEHTIAAGIHLWAAQGGAIHIIDMLIAALDKRDVETVWEVEWTGRYASSPGPGWEPFAIGPTHHIDEVVCWRRRVPRG